ncbi:hypothetical protein MBLNU459_g1280t1 [Dothideomycetes sp. NU459]
MTRATAPFSLTAHPPASAFFDTHDRYSRSQNSNNSSHRRRDDAAIMQNVWSRIAQTRLSCRCPSCLTTASGVARSTTTATGKRPGRYAYSSTLFYSGIFAAAATTDAGIKQRRRDQWDRAIADVKHDLEHEDAATPTPMPAYSVNTTAAEAALMARPHGDAGLERAPDAQEPSAEPSAMYTPVAAEDDEALFEPGCTPARPIWPANTGLRPVPHNLPPQSIYATAHAKRKTLDRRWTPKKLRSTELAVDKVILRLLLYMDDKECRAWAAQAIPGPGPLDELISSPRSHLEAMLDATQLRLDAVRRADTWLHQDTPERLPHSTQYHQDDDGYFHGTAADLNRALQDLFKKRAAGDLAYSHMLAKICYNLSVSTAPPNLQCWNTLLQGFINLGKNDHPVFITIRAIREANVRMNEQTIISVLNYYTSIGHSHRFTWFVGLMRGQGPGLSLARPDIAINEAGASRLIRVDDPATGATKVIQKPHATPGVFEALVCGVLHFAGFDAALRVCSDMGHDGWGLSMRGLTPLLRDRIDVADWPAAAALWAQIRRIQDRSRTDGRPERIAFATYVEALRMYAFAKDEAAFHALFDEALRASHSQKMLLETLRKGLEPKIQVRREKQEVPAAAAAAAAAVVAEEQDPKDDERLLSREHLVGDFAGTFELDDYEARERPMALSPSWG